MRTGVWSDEVARDLLQSVMSRGIVVGVVASHDGRSRAEKLVEGLPESLSEHVDSRTDWRAEVCETEPADASAEPSELTDSVRRHLLGRGWQMGIGLTELPLHVGRRPVVTTASATYGVGLVSVPALGAVGVDDRLHDAAVELVSGLLGEGPADGPDDGRDERLRTRSAELAAELPLETGARLGSLRFTQLAVSNNLRLLAGMIRANRPARVMARLSRSSTAALGTGAYALSSSGIWTIAHASAWPRLAAVAALSMVMILASLVVAHGLWERSDDDAARERVVLFNVVTITTLAIGIAALYLALVLILALAAAVTIPPAAFHDQVSTSPTVGEYARLAWFSASVATVGGALGSLVESDRAVRDAAYRPRGGQQETSDGD
ncbi:MAG: hypothetical protein JHC95_12625 [Solirubrobacteraceae bacterium]|nr:hypothetical protein [Solirubrobacteraceae bacterium]